MADLDEYAKGTRFGYLLAWGEARRIADQLGGKGVLDSASKRLDVEPIFIGVHPRDGGPRSLYCFDCGEWVPNTANTEMLKEGMFAHSHVCVSETADQIGGKIKMKCKRLRNLDLRIGLNPFFAAGPRNIPTRDYFVQSAAYMSVTSFFLPKLAGCANSVSNYDGDKR